MRPRVVHGHRDFHRLDGDAEGGAAGKHERTIRENGCAAFSGGCCGAASDVRQWALRDGRFTHRWARLAPKKNLGSGCTPGSSPRPAGEKSEAPQAAAAFEASFLAAPSRCAAAPRAPGLWFLSNLSQPLSPRKNPQVPLTRASNRTGR